MREWGNFNEGVKERVIENGKLKIENLMWNCEGETT